MTAAKPKTPHRGAAIKRILLIWAIQTVALIVGSLLMPKVEITNFGIAIIASRRVIWTITFRSLKIPRMKSSGSGKRNLSMLSMNRRTSF